MACTCGHSAEEHGHDPKHPTTSECNECSCLSYEEGPDSVTRAALAIEGDPRAAEWPGLVEDLRDDLVEALDLLDDVMGLGVLNLCDHGITKPKIEALLTRMGRS